MAVLGCNGLLWAVLRCTGLYLAVLGCTGLYWTVLGPVWHFLFIFSFSLHFLAARLQGKLCNPDKEHHLCHLLITGLDFPCLIKIYRKNSWEQNMLYTMHSTRHTASPTETTNKSSPWHMALACVSGLNQTSFDQMFITTCFMWLFLHV